MAIEIIFQSQSLKDEVEIQTSTSKWTFPAMQDEGSKKDIPDHTRIIFRESKCLISDFDNNKGTFQIFSEDSENITGDSLFFYGSLENIHNIHAKKSKKPMKNGAHKEDSKKDCMEDSTEDYTEDSKKDSTENFKEDLKGESKIGNDLPTSTNKDIFDLASAIKIKVQQESNGTKKNKWKNWKYIKGCKPLNYIEFLSEVIRTEPWLEIAHVYNEELFQFSGQEIVNFLALNAKLDNECNPKRHSNNEKITPDDFELNGEPSTDPYDFSDLGKSENLEESVLLLPKNLPKSGGVIKRTPYWHTCKDIPEYPNEIDLQNYLSPNIGGFEGGFQGGFQELSNYAQSLKVGGFQGGILEEFQGGFQYEGEIHDYLFRKESDSESEPEIDFEEYEPDAWKNFKFDTEEILKAVDSGTIRRTKGSN